MPIVSVSAHIHAGQDGFPQDDHTPLHLATRLGETTPKRPVATLPKLPRIRYLNSTRVLLNST